MAQRPGVPKFGNWESEENVPYTLYFEKARKGRTGTKMRNPNDPEEYLDPSIDEPPKPRADSEEPVKKESVRAIHERQKSSEDGNLRQFISPPARHDNMGNRTANETASPHHGGRGAPSTDNHRRPARQGAGSEHSTERSPLHRHAKAANRETGVNSPSWEGKGFYDSSHGTPGRSKLRPAGRGDETPDRSAAVPKFGDWDESNPASADGYTHIFNRVREERQGGVGQAPGTPTPRPYVVNNQASDDSVKFCCFSWRK